MQKFNKIGYVVSHFWLTTSASQTLQVRQYKRKHNGKANTILYGYVRLIKPKSKCITSQTYSTLEFRNLFW